MAFNKKQKVGLIVFVAAAILPLAFIHVQKWINTPAEQTISIGSQPAATPSSSFQTIESDYFLTVAPAGWRIQKTADKNVVARINIVAFARSTGQGQIGITSDLLPAGGLNEVGDYHLRAVTPSYYTPTYLNDLPPQAKAFHNLNNEGYTVFLVNKNRYASITVSSYGPDSKSLQLTQKILEAWQWR